MDRSLERAWPAWLWAGGVALLVAGVVLVRVSSRLDVEMSSALADERIHIERVTTIRRGARSAHVAVLERWLDPMSERISRQTAIEKSVAQVRRQADEFASLDPVSAAEASARTSLIVAVAVWSNRVTRALVLADGPSSTPELRASLDEIDRASDAVQAIDSKAGSSSDESVVMLHRTQALVQTAFAVVAIGILGVAIVGWRRLVVSERARAENQRSSKLRTQFFANMSHELRTPLIALRGFASTIEEHPDAHPEIQLAATRIDREAHDLLDAINNILDASKLEADKVQLRLEDVPLAPVVSRCTQRAQALIGTKPIALDVDVPPELPRLRADVVKLQQVLTNLLANAVKFTHEGRVSLRAKQIGQNVEIVVHDTGIGIRPDAVSRVWKPFEQGDASHDGSRRFGGTGLGLAIVRSIVELHGGTVSLTSLYGAGTRVTVLLPCAQGTSGGSRPPSNEQSAGAVSRAEGAVADA